MMLMIIFVSLLGIVLGSFVNALVWRVHEQEKRADDETKNASRSNSRSKAKQQNKTSTNRHPEFSSGSLSPLQKVRAYLTVILKPVQNDGLSIVHGRSMCPSCRHELAAKDLIPIISWLSLKGKCRYCNESISVQYPLVELVTGLLFAVSYAFWPDTLHGSGVALYGLWCMLLIGFVALSVYDLKWFLLPNRILFPLFIPALLFAGITVSYAASSSRALIATILAVVIGGGIFYLLYQVSSGRWIGGGDVKLGWLLGLIAGTPARALLFIFLASLLGTIVCVPLLYSKRLKKNHIIPFGPFLMAGLFIVQIWGTTILDWYTRTFVTL